MFYNFFCSRNRLSVQARTSARLTLCRDNRGYGWSLFVELIRPLYICIEEPILPRVVWIAMVANRAHVEPPPFVFHQVPRANHVVAFPLRHPYEHAAKSEGLMASLPAAHNNARVFVTVPGDLVAEVFGVPMDLIAILQETL